MKPSHLQPGRRLALCTLLAMALLLASSQYLAHFHVPQVASASLDEGLDHSGGMHCSLCLQFDKLPAPPSPLHSPIAHFLLIATIEAERRERLALDHAPLWPPSRGPPLLAC
jgi:hypothetical protein